MAIDWPGHGKSSHRPKGVHYDSYQYIADIKYVVDGELGSHSPTMSDPPLSLQL